MMSDPDCLISSGTSVYATYEGAEIRAPRHPGSIITVLLLLCTTVRLPLLHGMGKIPCGVVLKASKNQLAKKRMIKPASLLRGCFMAGCSTNNSGAKPIASSRRGDGVLKANKQLRTGIPKSFCHILVIISSAQISQSLGMVSISVKKMSDEMSRNAVRKGLNMRLPRGERMERGSPHATITGRETSVKNSCTMVNSSSQYLMYSIILFMK